MIIADLVGYSSLAFLAFGFIYAFVTTKSEV